MRATRISSWAVLTLLFLHGSGLLTTLHKFAHHSIHAEIHAPCDPSSTGLDAQHSNEQPSPSSPTPTDDDHCSICFGLNGLHLAHLPVHASIVDATEFLEHPAATSGVAAGSRTPGSRSARAPPIL